MPKESRFPLALDSDMRAWLKKEAKRQSRSVNQVIRLLITSAMKGIKL